MRAIIVLVAALLASQAAADPVSRIVAGSTNPLAAIRWPPLFCPADDPKFDPKFGYAETLNAFGVKCLCSPASKLTGVTFFPPRRRTMAPSYRG